jgi:hypothetical protein
MSKWLPLSPEVYESLDKEGDKMTFDAPITTESMFEDMKPAEVEEVPEASEEVEEVAE